MCDDTAAMLECLERLGLSISQSNTTVTLAGPMNLVDDVEINSRMSGASTRLLIALAALRSGKTSIDGHESLRARTNLPLVNALQKLGCQIDSSDGHLPLAVHRPIQTNRVRFDRRLFIESIHHGSSPHILRSGRRPSFFRKDNDRGRGGVKTLYRHHDKRNGQTRSQRPMGRHSINQY